jgi:hypothetical protein
MPLKCLSQEVLGRSGKGSQTQGSKVFKKGSKGFCSLEADKGISVETI